MTPWTEMRAACLIWREVRPVARLAMPRFTPPLWWECDVAVVLKASGYLHEYEIKLSLADFRADRKKNGKHAELAVAHPPMMGPNRFWYVVPENLAEAVRAELPPWAGLAVLRRSDRGHEWLERRQKPILRHRQPVGESLIVRAETGAMYRMWAALDRLHGAGRSDLWGMPAEPGQPEVST